MKTQLKGKNSQRLENIEAKEFVLENGKVLRDPANIRMGFEVIGLEEDSLEKRLNRMTIETLNNNKDKKLLDENIFGENDNDGYDEAEKRIALIDLVDYLYGIKNYDTITKFYRENSKLVSLASKINDLIEKATPLSELKKYRDNYYIVVGGNTRVSTLYNAYKENEKEWKANGSLKYGVPVSIIDYNYRNLFTSERRENVVGMTFDKVKELRQEYQIAYDLLCYADNALSGSRNNSIRSSMSAKGVIAKECVNWYRASSGNSIYSSDLAINKINAFHTLLKRCGVESDIALLEGLIFNTIEENGQHLEYSDRVKETDFFKKKTNPTFTNYATKVITGAISSRGKDKYDVMKETGRIFGLDVSTGEVADKDAFINGLEWIASHRLSLDNPEAGSYLAKSIKDSIDDYSKKIKKGRKLDNKEIKKVFSSALKNSKKECEMKNTIKDNIVQKAKAIAGDLNNRMNNSGMEHMVISKEEWDQIYALLKEVK